MNKMKITAQIASEKNKNNSKNMAALTRYGGSIRCCLLTCLHDFLGLATPLLIEITRARKH